MSNKMMALLYHYVVGYCSSVQVALETQAGFKTCNFSQELSEVWKWEI